MYGPVRTVVWQGSAGDRGPYADLVGKPYLTQITSGLLVTRSESGSMVRKVAVGPTAASLEKSLAVIVNTLEAH